MYLTCWPFGLMRLDLLSTLPLRYTVLVFFIKKENDAPCHRLLNGECKDVCYRSLASLITPDATASPDQVIHRNRPSAIGWIRSRTGAPIPTDSFSR